NRTVASGSREGTVKLWDLTTKQVRVTFQGHVGYVYAVAFSPDGKMVASGGLDGVVKMWDAQSGNVVRSFGRGGYEIHAVAFSPDGQFLAGGQPVRLWHVATGKEMVFPQGVLASSIAFSPDGKTLATADHGYRVTLWNLVTKQARVTLQN